MGGAYREASDPLCRPPPQGRPGSSHLQQPCQHADVAQSRGGQATYSETGITKGKVGIPATGGGTVKLSGRWSGLWSGLQMLLSQLSPSNEHLGQFYSDRQLS